MNPAGRGSAPGGPLWGRGGSPRPARAPRGPGARERASVRGAGAGGWLRSVPTRGSGKEAASPLPSWPVPGFPASTVGGFLFFLNRGSRNAGKRASDPGLPGPARYSECGGLQAVGLGREMSFSSAPRQASRCPDARPGGPGNQVSGYPRDAQISGVQLGTTRDAGTSLRLLTPILQVFLSWVLARGVWRVPFEWGRVGV